MRDSYMNYRHSYHAGNFADVVKHIVLIAILETLKHKDAPFCYLDTHAGLGLYELKSEQALKTEEYQAGIAKLFSIDDVNAPDIVRRYITLVKNLNAGSLQYYPGSPLIAQSLLRAQDKIVLSELHPEDYQTLKINMGYDKRVSIHNTDAYLAMKAFLPPKENRGLVLIDPPFEKTDEFDQIIRALKIALKCWRSGHFMIWYPIKNQKQINHFYRDIDALNTDYFKIHFQLNQMDPFEKLSACGILLINPPWKIKELCKESLLPYLEKWLDGKSKIYHTAR